MSEYKSVNYIASYTIVGEGNTVVNEKGQIEEWPSSGALDDFGGLYETQQLEKFNKDNEDAKWEAWYQCVSYSTEGFPQGSWYLPSLGELYLVYKISNSRVKKLLILNILKVCSLGMNTIIQIIGLQHK